MIAALLAIVSAFTPIAPAQTAAPLSAFLEARRAECDLPALGAALIYDGKIIESAAVGRRSLLEEEKAEIADLWHIGSCTKAMTATLIGMLVERGVMRWETTVSEAFPSLREESDGAFRDVTVEQLLQHRAGLPDDRKPDAIFGKMLRMTGTVQEQRREIARLSLAEQPKHPPGTAFEYSNRGYIIAGAMAEAMTGASWEQLMQEHLFEPLRMRTAGFGAPGVADNISQPRGHRSGIAVEPGPYADNPASLGPAGTVHVSLEDWSRFAALHLAGARGEPKLLRKVTFNRLHTPPEGGNYALGWGVSTTPAGDSVLRHVGSNTRFVAAIWIVPKKNAAMLFVTNCGDQGAFDAIDPVMLELLSRAPVAQGSGASNGGD